jgi:predicted MFS family arabinose efflux permease
MLAPLRVAAFGRLLFGYTLNSVGDFVGLVALAVLVYDETGSAMATSALFIGGQFVPAFLAPAATARVDQLPLRAVLPSIYLAEAAIFGALAILAGVFSLLPVLILASLDGVLMLTARGLTRGAVNAVLAPRGLLREGNALLNVAFAASNVGGAALGGLLVHRFGVATALWVDATSFALIAVVLVTSTRLPRADSERERFWARVRGGLLYVRENRSVRWLLVGQSIALVFFTLIVPIEVVYANKTLHTDEAGFGLLLSAWGTGIVLGSLLFVAVKRRSTRVLVLTSTLAMGLAYLGMAAARELWLACAFCLLGGAGNGIQWVAVMTALQEATPADLQARITGLLESSASAMTGVGFLLGGLITAIFSPAAAFAVAGSGVVLMVFLGVLAGPAAFPEHPVPEPLASPLTAPGPGQSGIHETPSPAG